MSEQQTLVAVHLAHELTPIQPHTPGSYILGYLDGDQKEAEASLCDAAQEKRNILLHNAWLMSIGIKFQQAHSPEGTAALRGLTELARKVQEQDPQLTAAIMMHLKPLADIFRKGEDPAATNRVDVNHAHLIIPITNMDPTNGLDYSVPATYWWYPKGSMLTEIESQIAHMRTQLLNSRSNLAIAQSMPDELKGPHN